MPAYRVRVLYEDYLPYSTEEVANFIAESVSDLLTEKFPEAKVVTYVEHNPPLDEIEEYL